jgi:peptidoglycan-associated lipoprotein
VNAKRTQIKRTSYWWGALICILASACSSVPTRSADSVSAEVRTARDPASAFTDGNQTHDSDGGSALGLESVHFVFNAQSLSPETKARLKKNAIILKNNPKLIIQIEGYCDQKGSEQYNLILGDKRAAAVKAFLVHEGISVSRLVTISFGKEHPVDSGNSDEARAKNRRANFTIVSV